MPGVCRWLQANLKPRKIKYLGDGVSLLTVQGVSVISGEPYESKTGDQGLSTD